MKFIRSDKSFVITIIIVLVAGLLLIWFFKAGREDFEREEEQEQAIKAKSRIIREKGEVLITLNKQEQQKAGILITPVQTLSHRNEISVSGVFIPDSAFVWLDGDKWVYIQIATERFVRRKIKNGIRLKNGWFVSREFSTEDRIVTVGAQMLLSEEFLEFVHAGEEQD